MNFSNNPICKLLGIKYPIIQGGMAMIADAALAAAVSNGGGLGIIAAMKSTGEELRAEIRRARRLTDKPFGVNLMLQSPYTPEAAKVVIEEGVKVVTTGAGNPAEYIKEWKAAGIAVIPVVPAVSFAKLMERAGASAIICEGCEAGGHIGEATTMALVPQVRDAVSVPVVAAGGIADGRGLAAAFMLGADGVQVGTRFLAATECGIHSNYKEVLFKANDNGTVVIGRRSGHAMRALKTPFSLSFQRTESESADFSEAILKSGTAAFKAAIKDGDKENGSFVAGQIAGLVKREQPAAEIITEMFSELERLMQGAGNKLT